MLRGPRAPSGRRRGCGAGRAGRELGALPPPRALRGVPGRARPAGWGCRYARCAPGMAAMERPGHGEGRGSTPHAPPRPTPGAGPRNQLIRPQSMGTSEKWTGDVFGDSRRVRPRGGARWAAAWLPRGAGPGRGLVAWRCATLTSVIDLSPSPPGPARPGAVAEGEVLERPRTRFQPPWRVGNRRGRAQPCGRVAYLHGAGHAAALAARSAAREQVVRDRGVGAEHRGKQPSREPAAFSTSSAPRRREAARLHRAEKAGGEMEAIVNRLAARKGREEAPRHPRNNLPAGGGSARIGPARGSRQSDGAGPGWGPGLPGLRRRQHDQPMVANRNRATFSFYRANAAAAAFSFPIKSWRGAPPRPARLPDRSAAPPCLCVHNLACRFFSVLLNCVRTLPSCGALLLRGVCRSVAASRSWTSGWGGVPSGVGMKG